MNRAIRHAGLLIILLSSFALIPPFGIILAKPVKLQPFKGPFPEPIVFHREILGMPQQLTEREKLLRELADEYHKRCDEYDNRVCTGTNHRGEKVPETTYQYADIVNNARKVRQELEARALQNGITLGELSGAIQLVRIYKR